jgi:hypothetical protein
MQAQENILLHHLLRIKANLLVSAHETPSAFNHEINFSRHYCPICRSDDWR